MIRTFKININAAFPELSPFEASAFVGSPSTAFIDGVPPAVGKWRITSVYVAATYPNGTVHSIAATRAASGVWAATIPATEVGGRVASGFQVLANGTDEKGGVVAGYCLAVCDLAIYLRDLTPSPGPTPAYIMHLFSAPPSPPKIGDVAPIGGHLSVWNGSAWKAFDAAATIAAAAAMSRANSAMEAANNARAAIPYALDPEGRTINAGSPSTVSLLDRTVNRIVLSTDVTVAGLVAALPFPFVPGRARDFFIRFELASGATLSDLSFTLSQGESGILVLETADGSLPAPQTGVTLAYFSELSPGVFLVKSENLQAVGGAAQ